MTTSRGNSTPSGAATVATLTAYMATILPAARREIGRWRRRAQHIPDDDLRQLALGKLDHEHLNAEAAAIFALVAPRRRRAAVAELLAGWQVMYDLLDTLTEQPSSDPLANSLLLHLALTDSVSPSPTARDYYALHPRRDDGGYLAELVTAARERLRELPATDAVSDVLRRETRRCGEAQSHTHAAVLTHDDTELRRWATRTDAGPLRWHELAAGGISSLAVLALLGAAGDPRTTARDAERIAAAYSPWICALSTLLDSIVDLDRDRDTGNLSYAGYYPSPDDTAERMTAITTTSANAAHALPHPGTHATIVAGLAAYYLSAAPVSRAPIATPIITVLRPTITPPLAFMRVRRRAAAASA